MLTIQDVHLSYGGSVKAVDGVTLSIRKGEIFGLLGPNGAGKTSLIKMITGALQPDAGTIVVNGHDIVSDALAAKFDIGLVTDNPNVFLRLRGREYLAYMADIYQVPAEGRKEKIMALAKAFEMEGALASKIQAYSHGMRQKIVLMGALLHDPPVWILDEPMTGLDPQSSFILKAKMREHTEAGNTVLFSTHVLEVAEKLCDRVAIISNGKIVICDSLEAIREQQASDQSLEEIFLQLTGSVYHSETAGLGGDDFHALR